jgi:amino acid adenylation domain
MGTCIETPAADAVNPRFTAVNTESAEETVRHRCIQQLFEAQAASNPNANALVFEHRELTYAELDSRANQVARVLQKHGVGPDSLVALRVERSPEMIIGIFGILKAGGAYVPIDPAYPIVRQQAILSDSRTKVLLTQQHLAPIAFDGTVLDLNDTNLFASEPVSAPSCEASEENLAYAIYTSGSTGAPKGVLVTHSNLLHSTNARFRYYTEPVERYLLLSSHSFDSSVAGIFWTLSAGGALVLPHEYSHQTASELADLISRHRVSHLLCLPSLYNVLLEQFAAFGSLRCVIVAGETCPPALVERHHALLPGAVLYNEYGPTEATVWSTVYKCWRATGYRTIPIGRAIPGADVYILDEQLHPVLNGANGEIYIGGPGVARGYFNRPDLTASKFVTASIDSLPATRLYRTGDRGRWLPDGTIEFLGRMDNQIKIRGHRIELEEIEAVLRQHSDVTEAVVIVREKSQSGPPNGETDSLILKKLNAMPQIDAERLLQEIERQTSISAHHAAMVQGHVNATRDRHVRQSSEFDITIEFKQPDFIQPPRATQRKWLLNRTLDEFEADLRELNTLSKQMVPGAEPSLQTLLADRSQTELSEPEILEDWHIPLMQSMAKAVTSTHGDILEIGFGRGVASEFLQQSGVRSHTIIECNDSVIRRFYEPWRTRHADRNIRLLHGRWQDVINSLGRFDGIFFQTYPLNEREFTAYLSRSIVFAEHFFPTAASHLREGGAFTYLTHEIDSLSRRHQRLVFRHFQSLTTRIQKLQLPDNCADLWWSDSMVVATAFK